MRIAVDARELIGKATGVGRYLAEILAAWGLLPAAASHEIILCAPEPVPLPDASALRCRQLTTPGHGTRWEQWALPRLVRSAGADILFAPGYTGPLFSPVPMVVTIHDVSFAAHPEWFSRREGLRRRFLTARTARRAHRVLTVSDFSKREIIRHLGVAPAKVEVIYSGASALALPGRDEGAAEPLVLYVGSIFTRRHIPELVQGFSMLAGRHPDARLVLVGDNRTRPRLDIEALVRSSGASGRISVLDYVTHEELSRLYGRAWAFVFLSDYEGFGLTPLEAAAAGIPMIVLDTEVSREIYGPAAEYVDRAEPRLIADALERVLYDAGERARLRGAAPGVLQRYSWQECAHRTLQALLSAAHKAPSPPSDSTDTTPTVRR